MTDSGSIPSTPEGFLSTTRSTEPVVIPEHCRVCPDSIQQTKFRDPHCGCLPESLQIR